MLQGAGSGDNIFDVTYDGTVSQVFVIQKFRLQENTEIIMGGEPSVICKPAADFHIVCAGICQNGVENLMELMPDVVAVYNVGGQGVRDNARQIFQNKTEGIVQRRFPFCIKKAVKCSVKAADIDAETGESHVVSGIVEVSYTVKGFFILRILLQRKDKICGFIRGTQDRIGELSERENPGRDDSEIHAYYHHGIGDHRGCQIQERLDGSVHQPGFKQCLTPFLICLENLLRCFHKNNRIRFGNYTDVGNLRRNILIWKSGQDHHAVKWISEKIFRRFCRNVDEAAGKRLFRFVMDSIFQTGLAGKRFRGLKVEFLLQMP